MSSIGNFISAILHPLEVVVAYIMVGFHSLLSTLGMPAASGWTWALSIVGLVIVIRIILIPLFVKQIKASRGLQLIQPEIQKIQKKYKGKTDPASRQAMTQETMALYKESGTNPFASCLPILLQSPVFFALYRVLQNIASSTPHAIGIFSLSLIAQADHATLFGARLSDKFIGADSLSTQILTIVLIVLMSASTFTTQRQLMQKNMPASALDNPFARQQKMLMYVLPLFFAISGVNFPIGVLLYWLTTNVWSMGQQFYVIRRMPAPGSQAERDLEARRARKAAAKGQPIDGGAGVAGANGAGGTGSADDAEPVAPAGQRQQPKRNQPRSKRVVKPPTSAPGPAAESAPGDEAPDGAAPEAGSTPPVTPAANGSANGPTGSARSAGTNGASGSNGQGSKRSGKGKASDKPGPAKTG
jgi:YidC/Oxa1 family membrane protein insertase